MANREACSQAVGGAIIIALFYLLRVFPIKKNKVIATAFGGIRYGDNPKSMLEALHELVPEVDIVWVKSVGQNMNCQSG